MKKIFGVVFITVIILTIVGIIFYTWQTSLEQEEMASGKLIITSPAFKDGEKIPSKYTCDGENINPELNIEGIPEGTKSLVLIVDDPDAPAGTWVHWVVFNIPVPPNATEIKIAENSVPGEEGMNDFKKTSYGGPCPPSGSHRYYFRVYALDTKLNLDFATKSDVELAMKNHILAKGELIGRFR